VGVVGCWPEVLAVVGGVVAGEVLFLAVIDCERSVFVWVQGVATGERGAFWDAVCEDYEREGVLSKLEWTVLATTNYASY
jgi:hypothetical protein